MTGRPDPDAMAPLVLDDRGRLRPEMIVKEFRCKKRHQRGAIVRTAHGPLLAWRTEPGPAATRQWVLDWLDAVPDAVLMTCNCRRAVWLEDVTPYRGTVR